MNILISGSLAYDYIMDFPDSFKNHILQDQLHILNVCFVVDELQKNFGGTAGNIAYTMKLLGGNPIIIGALGKDANEYIEWFKTNNIQTKNIAISNEKMTSSAHITTDKDDNQITAFYPGAGGEAQDILLDNKGNLYGTNSKVTLGLISPAEKKTMLRHALQLHNAEIPFCFDPGQQITALSPQELMATIGQAKFLIGNDYEMKLIQEKTGWNTTEILNHVEMIIITLGEKGSVITNKHGILEIKSCSPKSIEDPTGAGDAYRAGFFWGYAKGLEIKTCAQVASVSASYAIEHYGTQKHTFTFSEFENRYSRQYGEPIE